MLIYCRLTGGTETSSVSWLKWLIEYTGDKYGVNVSVSRGGDVITWSNGDELSRRRRPYDLDLPSVITIWPWPTIQPWPTMWPATPGAWGILAGTWLSPAWNFYWRLVHCRQAGEGIYDHQHKVFMEVEAFKEAATSLSTHDNLLYNPVSKTLKILIVRLGRQAK